MRKKKEHPWSKIKIHSDGSIEIDPREIMRQYREQFEKARDHAAPRATDFGKLRKRPAR